MELSCGVRQIIVVMDNQEPVIDLDDLGAFEESIIAEYSNARFGAGEYRQVFYPVESGTWNPETHFPEGFFDAAHALLQGIVDRSLNAAWVGAAAIFLSRHYVELQLKFVLFHARWLKTERRNAEEYEIEPVGNAKPIPQAKRLGHDLQKLWDTLSRELRARGPGIVPAGLDMAFVESFVHEFHTVDRFNDRFRYPGKQLPVERSPEQPLSVDYEALLIDLQRVHDVLETLDSYLIETHGENDEWESIQDSW